MRDRHSTFVASFWESFNNCITQDDYEQLLFEIEDYYSTYNERIANDCTFNKTQTPYLAMISEINQACPSILIKKANQNSLYQTALFILKNYSDNELRFLRHAFLKYATHEFFVLHSRK